MASHLVAVNELGRRVGDSHHNAKLTNGEVELLLEMHSEGWGYRRLAAKFEVTASAIRYIIKGRNRGQRVERWKRVEFGQIPGHQPSLGGW